MLHSLITGSKQAGVGRFSTDDCLSLKPVFGSCYTVLKTCAVLYTNTMKKVQLNAGTLQVKNDSYINIPGKRNIGKNTL